MNNYKITIVDNLSEEIEQKMERDLITHEASQSITVNYHLLSVVLTEQDGNVAGVLNAYTAFAEIYIDDIWVEKSRRGKGYGTKLLQVLEDYFTGKGFNNMNLVTSAFQAPEFYRKCGFTAEFVRENSHNPQFTKTFFVKYFPDEVQSQGLINKQ